MVIESCRGNTRGHILMTDRTYRKAPHGELAQILPLLNPRIVEARKLDGIKQHVERAMRFGEAARSVRRPAEQRPS